MPIIGLLAPDDTLSRTDERLASATRDMPPSSCHCMAASLLLLLVSVKGTQRGSHPEESDVGSRALN